MSDYTCFVNLIGQISDLLRGAYRWYERVVLPMSVLCCLDCVLGPTRENVLEEYERLKGRLPGDGREARLNNVAGERFHNRLPLDFEKLKGDPDRIARHLMSYIKGFRCLGLVIDWRMKELSGLVLIRKMRRIRPDLPVVIVSGEISQVMKEWKMENEE